MTTDRERDDQHTALVLAAETALTSAERATFLSRFDRSQAGASVADVLDTLHSNDSNIELVEQLAERHGNQVPEPGLLAVAIQIANQLDYQGLFMRPWETLEPLIERIRPLLGLPSWELRIEREKRDKLELLAPLGFEDYDDGEQPGAIWHPLIGNINYGSVRLDNVIDLAFKAGQQQGMSELRAKFRALLDVAPAPRPEDGQ
jgi:hypothetical protein